MRSILVIALVATSFVCANADDSQCDNLFDKHCAELNTISSECSAPSIIDRLVDRITGSTADLREITRRNQKAIAELESTPVAPSTVDRKSQLSAADVEALYKTVADHPVAALKQLDRYDPKNFGIGFCFGRAMTAHLEALWTFKLNNSSIRKAWAVGSLGESWKFHVTTLVRGDDGAWWAIDPTRGRPVKAKDWLKDMEQMSTDGKMRLYITEAKRFGATKSAPYNSKTINNPFYNSFFTDLLDHYRD